MFRPAATGSRFRGWYAAVAAQLDAQRLALLEMRKIAFFDINQEDAGASFWPSTFYWSKSPEPGIYCRGEWTVKGAKGVEGKEWSRFRPVFYVASRRENPARIVCHGSAKPNMGIVNDDDCHGLHAVCFGDGPDTVKAKATGPYTAPAFQPDRGLGGGFKLGLETAGVNARLVALSAIEDDALFAEASAHLVSTL